MLFHLMDDIMTDIGQSQISFGGVSYLLRATFDATDQGYVNGQVLDTVSEGVQDGQLTVIELDGTLAIVSNEMAFTAQSTPVAGEQGMYSQIVTKALGRGLLCSINIVDNKEVWPGIGWFSSTVLVQANSKYGLYLDFRLGQDSFKLIIQGAVGVKIVSGSISTDYQLAIILGGSDINSLPYYNGQTKADYVYGAWFLIKGGAFTDWTLLWITSLDNTASLYAALSNWNSTGTLDDFRVPDRDLSAIQDAVTNFSSFAAANGTSLDTIIPEVGTAWTEQSGNWDIQSNRANPDGAAIATIVAGVADIMADCVVNGGVADNPSIVLRFSDTSNYWYLQADRANNQLELHEINVTIDTVRANAAVVINDSTDYDLRVIADAQVIDGFLDAANKISYGSAVLNETETVHGIRAENTVGQFDNFAIFPRTATIYGTTLDGV